RVAARLYLSSPTDLFIFLSLLITPRPRISSLFPYTTLFRSFPLLEAATLRRTGIQLRWQRLCYRFRPQQGGSGQQANSTQPGLLPHRPIGPHAAGSASPAPNAALPPSPALPSWCAGAPSGAVRFTAGP